MIKVADKPSMDPAQQKLRQAKKQWNKDVSAFIDDLIHYKKLTNGQPNKFFKERSAIKEPIPADPATILGTLANDFQELSQRGGAIIAAQLEYSKTRRKKQPKPAPETGATPVATPEAPGAPDLGKQLAAFEMKYDLVAEGSSPVSRFFTKMLNPGIGFGEAARIRKYRMSLLSLCAKMFKEVGKFQVEIVKSSNDSINRSHTMLNDKIWHDWDLIYKGLVTYKNNMPKEVVDAGGPIEAPADQEKGKETPPAPAPTGASVPDQEKGIADVMAKVKAIQADYTKSYKNLGSDIMMGADTALEAALFKFMKSPGPMKPVAAQKVIEEYNNLLQALNQSLGTSGTSVTEIANQKGQSATANASVNQLEKVAQDFLWKWLGKKRHQMSSNINSGYRLDLYKMGDEVRENLNKMMDSLESGMNLEQLMELAANVHRQVLAMKGLTRALYANMPKPKGKGKGKPTGTDFFDRYM
jgi:hypothetical protein